LGGASDTSSNPYDDDVAYYPFAKQLLERGTLMEPFSFRRMSTLGGQAFFHALMLLRVSPLHLNVFDRAVCFALAAALLASHRVGGRAVPVFARIASVAFLVALPNTSINSASYYSGLAFFLAFFQTLELMRDAPSEDWRAAARRAMPLALVGAALATLRQNYQLVVAAVVVLSYASFAYRWRASSRFRRALVEGAVAAGLVGLFVLPWLILLYRSNQTFLFPLMKGTFRAGVDVRSKTMTAFGFVRLFVDVWLKPDPIHTLPLFMLVGLYLRQDGPRRPLASQWIAGFVSLLFLTWAFSLSDADNLTRYSFGFLTASALLTWQRAAGLFRTTRFSFQAVAVPAALVLAMLDPPLSALDPHDPSRTKRMLDAQLRDVDELLRRTIPEQAEPPVAAAYHDIQNGIPRGARLLVMVDRPYLFDYGRNEIWNLDMPGAASPSPELPCFQGPEPVAAYLLSHGIRYVAFVLPDRSTFLYRRSIWFDHIYDPVEMWRVYAPYITNVIDNLVSLSQSRQQLLEREGMVLVDLQERR
jgi:hypothetical protein